MPHVFVSYSRRQFYAAQQLAMALSGSGHETWFDVERLAPGVDWNASINQAIDDAGALVLVASPEAIASRYVQREWQRARDNGIGVYVAVVRGTRLPPELRDVPRVDLRRRFDPGVERLAEAIRGAELPAPHRWAVWPASVLLVALTLGLNALAAAGLLAVAALDLDYPIPETHRTPAAVMGAVGLVYAGWLLRPLRAFCSGRARLISIALPMYGTVPLLLLVWGVLGSLIYAVNHGVNFINEAGISGARTGPYVLVLLPLLVLNTTTLLMLFRSPAVLRRLPPGEAPRRLLARLIARYPPRPSASPPPVAAIRTITVHRAEADAAIGNQISWAFRSADIRTVTTDADLHLVVISNATSWDESAERLRSGRSIAVLACGVRLPDEAEDLRRLQWVDFRDGRADRLRELAASLNRPGESARTGAVPRGAGTFDAPRPVKIVLECLIAAIAVFALSAIFSASVAPPSDERVHTRAQPMVPYVPPPVTPAPWRPLLDCSPALPSSPGELPLPLCRFTAPSLPPATSHPALVPNPDYPALPGSADAVLRVRAWLAAALAVIALVLAIPLGRRALRPGLFENGMMALFLLTATWILLGAAELPPQRIGWYAAIWIAAAVGLTRHASTITDWLPGDRPTTRHRLPAVPAGLMRPTIPTALLLLGVWYSGGIIL